ncbi:hypothetical protein FRB91_001086 [Serendipita sp. 411]|nr:hypothetical protein FRB91_001086 [Serendipita sp. 411]
MAAAKQPDLQLGTPRADALQTAIHDELVVRGFTTGEDKVMAEYVLIMLINKKTPEQVNSELSDFIGPETWDPTFVDWLFEEANKETPGVPHPSEETKQAPAAAAPAFQAIPSVINDQRERERERDNRRAGPTPRLYNQAVSGAQKRTASNRSPSPTGSPNKAPRRNNETPSGPRFPRENQQGEGNRRSLKDRLGLASNGGGFPRDQGPNQMGAPGPNQGPPGMRFPGPSPGPGMPPMGVPFGPELQAMQAMNPNFAVTDMLMQQNALLQGLLHTMANGMQMPMGGMPGMPPFAGVGPGGPPQFNNGPGPQDRRGRPERRDGPFRGNPPQTQNPTTPTTDAPAPGSSQDAAPIVAPTPGPPLPPDLFNRPLSPTLCKYGVACGNALCRWSHPSAAASAESGIVLSTEACPNGRRCQDKDCTLSHPSVGTNMGIPATQRHPGAPSASPAPNAFSNAIPCKFGVNCNRPGCPFSHPTPTVSKSAVPCKFGIHCTRGDCLFSHPPGRVNPASYKGISMTPTPDKPHANRSMRFNTSAPEFVPKVTAGSQAPSADKQDNSAVTPSATAAKDPAEVVAAV